MEEKPYVVILQDDYLEESYNDGDLDEFVESLDEWPMYRIEEFDDVDSGINFLKGLLYGRDERSPHDKIALASWIEYDRPFIDAVFDR